MTTSSNYAIVNKLKHKNLFQKKERETMKKTLLKLTKFAYFFSCFSMLFTIPAHAYIDPSAVTYVIQAVAGVLIALGAMATVFRHKIFAFFKKNAKQGTKREIHMTEEANDSVAEDK